jgi:hypothetical protein
MQVDLEGNGNTGSVVTARGLVGRRLQSRGLVDVMWLAGASGWSGFEDALRGGTWSLFQRDLHKHSDIGDFNYDGNVTNPSFDDFGQFGVLAEPRPIPVAVLFKVTARSGLNLRAGPDDSFKILQTLPNGRIVTGNGREGAWMQVDLEGNGQADGYMFARFLTPLSGGLPVPVPPPPGGLPSPIEVARAEMALGVAEIPGPEDNPRIAPRLPREQDHRSATAKAGRRSSAEPNRIGLSRERKPLPPS